MTTRRPLVEGPRRGVCPNPAFVRQRYARQSDVAHGGKHPTPPPQRTCTQRRSQVFRGRLFHQSAQPNTNFIQQNEAVHYHDPRRRVCALPLRGVAISHHSLSENDDSSEARGTAGARCVDVPCFRAPLSGAWRAPSRGMVECVGAPEGARGGDLWDLLHQNYPPLFHTVRPRTAHGAVGPPRDGCATSRGVVPVVQGPEAPGSQLSSTLIRKRRLAGSARNTWS